MDDLTTKNDQELEKIIRRAENTRVSGSLYQRAKIELELRDRKRAEKRETLKLKPEIYGIGIDLKAAWQKIKNHFRK